MWDGGDDGGVPDFMNTDSMYQHMKDRYNQEMGTEVVDVRVVKAGAATLAFPKAILTMRPTGLRPETRYRSRLARWLKSQVFDVEADDGKDQKQQQPPKFEKVATRNTVKSELARHYRVNQDVTTDARRALRRMYVWHLGGSVALRKEGLGEGPGAHAFDHGDDHTFPDDPILVDELEALLDWVWESYWPAGGPLNEDEREEVVERFEKWRHRRHGSTHVPFAAFARWFLQLERLFVYLRRHETGMDVVLIMD